MSAERDIKSIISKIVQATKDLKSRGILGDLGWFVVNMIQKRTRLGYGVDKVRRSDSSRSSGISKVKLKPLSDRYKLFRKKTKKASLRLSRTTTANKSNLTFTGQMLRSMQIIRIGVGFVVVGPQGSRDDGFTNEEIATKVTEEGRPFNDLYDLEQKKLQRYYRKTYGDLLKKEKLLKY